MYKVVYAFDERKLIHLENKRTIAVITQSGLLYINPLYITSYNVDDINKFIKEYRPIGFYNKETETIYKRYLSEESTK